MPEEIFALRIHPVKHARVTPLPRMYSRKFETGAYVLGGADADVKFIVIGSGNRPDLKTLKGAIDTLRTGSEQPIVVVSPSLDYGQKEWLTLRQVPFIQNAQNAYLPFAGLVARGRSKGRRPSTLSPQAQRIMVNLIEGNWNDTSAGELARRLGKSRASVSKYLAEIEAISPRVVVRAGRRALLSRDGMTSAELLDCFEPYLRSPVSHRLHVSSTMGPEALYEAGARLSGLAALAQVSDIAADEAQPSMAIPCDALGSAIADPSWQDEEGLIVEAWRYWDDFPMRHGVGRLSLYLSLKDRLEDDERVTDAVDQLREEICR